MSFKGKALLRMWGVDAPKVAAMRAPDASEPDDSGVLVYFFDTCAAREAFRAAVVTAGHHVVHDAGRPENNEHAHLLTWAKVTLTYAGKDYGFDDCFGFGYPRSSAHYMYEEGNYACDCNRSAFIRHRCSVPAMPDLECGHLITLKSLVVEYRQPKLEN